ncbi:MAG: RlmE family RNA methyltransferase [Alphaproteobacteria bacterium]
MRGAGTRGTGARGTGARGTGARDPNVRLRTARKRSNSSARWLERQLNDPYVAEAKRQGWRSRAAFKLLELDDRFRLLRPGLRVLDLGAAPGGWTQVAVARTGGTGRIAGVDIAPMDPIEGAVLLQLDATDPEADAAIAAALGGPADIVLSDMAPSTIGHAATDKLRILAMADAAYDLGRTVLAPGGAFVCKLFQGGAHADLLNRLKRDFALVRHAKPPASRKDSAEIYLIATGFRGGPE